MKAKTDKISKAYTFFIDKESSDTPFNIDEVEAAIGWKNQRLILI